MLSVLSVSSEILQILCFPPQREERKEKSPILYLHSDGESWHQVCQYAHTASEVALERERGGHLGPRGTQVAWEQQDSQMPTKCPFPL